MPLYEYRCKPCETRWEEIRPASRADAPAACPACASEQTLRLLSVFTAHSKQSGIGQACVTSQEFGTPCCRTQGMGGMCGFTPH